VIKSSQNSVNGNRNTLSDLLERNPLRSLNKERKFAKRETARIKIDDPLNSVEKITNKLNRELLDDNGNIQEIILEKKIM
jgi:hypothetical protein